MAAERKVPAVVRPRRTGARAIELFPYPCAGDSPAARITPLDSGRGSCREHSRKGWGSQCRKGRSYALGSSSKICDCAGFGCASGPRCAHETSSCGAVRVPIPSHSDQLCRNGDRNLFRRNRSNVQTNRRMNSLKKLAEDLRSAIRDRWRSSSASIRSCRCTAPWSDGPAQDAHVVAVAARHDDDVVRR